MMLKPTKLALVGDPHGRTNDLDEVRRLFAWVNMEAEKHHVDGVCIMGDLYDTHALARVEVFHAWREILGSIQFPVFLISGNHDMNNEASLSWLDAHDQGCKVVSKGLVSLASLAGPEAGRSLIWACPFTKDNDKFCAWMRTAAEAGAQVLLCHQEFNGCDLGNGFYSPNGVQVGSVPGSLTAVSGHIHKAQSLAREEDDGPDVHWEAVRYVGSSRYITRTDANSRKSISIMTANGSDVQFVDIPIPDDVVEMYRKYQINQGQAVPNIPDSSRAFVEVSGDRTFVREVLAKIPKNCQVRTTVVEEKQVAVKESEGIPKAFMKYSAGKLADLTQEEREGVMKLVLDACPMLRQ